MSDIEIIILTLTIACIVLLLVSKVAAGVLMLVLAVALCTWL